MPIFQHIVKSHSSNFIHKKYQTRLFIRWLIFNLLILHRKTIALLNWVGKEDYENYCKGWNTMFGQTLIILQVHEYQTKYYRRKKAYAHSKRIEIHICWNPPWHFISLSVNFKYGSIIDILHQGPRRIVIPQNKTFHAALIFALIIIICDSPMVSHHTCTLKKQCLQTTSFNKTWKLTNESKPKLIVWKKRSTDKNSVFKQPV